MPEPDEPRGPVELDDAEQRYLRRWSVEKVMQRIDHAEIPQTLREAELLYRYVTEREIPDG